MDAAVPTKTYQKDDGNWTNLKWEVFGEDHSSAFGLSLYKERYWSDAFNWLSQQDTEIEDPLDRPAFISWWDYGFYEVAIGGHPTVADNFQDGIPPASNFHTVTSEKEAVAVWIIRLLEGDMSDNGCLSDDTKQILLNYLGEKNSLDLISWVEDATISPSYKSYVDEQFNEYISKEEINENILTVGSQWPANAVYHDFVDMVNNGNFSENKTGLTDEEVTSLYHDLQYSTGYSIRYYGVEGYDKQIFNIFAFLSDKSLVMLGAPEDAFVEVTYSGREYTPGGSVKRTIEGELLKDYLDMSDTEKRYIYVQSTSTNYKDPYFDTMFYKTYVGPYDVDSTTGAKKEYQWQLPCIQMKHFYAEHISDMSKYQYYNTGKAAVVIAKYYEGALINGSIWFNDTKVDAAVVVQKNLTYYEGADQPIDHDSFYYVAYGENATEEFNVIAGEGSYLQLRKNLGEMIFVMKNITFNGEIGSEYAPISDDDAMRLDGSNYERHLNISIQPGNISGVLYNDVDENGVYNTSVDEPLEDFDIQIWEVQKIQDGQITQQGEPTNIKTDENGFYSTSGLEPGIYRIWVYNKDGNTVHLNDISIYEGENKYDIINPKLGDIDGTVYYDENSDDSYTAGEEKSGAEVTISYPDVSDPYGSTKEFGTTTTNSNGYYKFEDLASGEYNKYTITVTKAPEYRYTGTITIDANQTKSYNISLELTPVKLTGQTSYDGLGVEGVTIEFDKDESIGTNTAEDAQAITDESGAYSIDLQPGNYNISAVKTDGTTIVYMLEGEKLEVAKGQDDTTKDIELVKKSVTISGVTSSYGTNIEKNVTIDFSPDTSLENYTAFATSTVSDIAGSYSVEVTPGVYIITAESEEFVEDDVYYTYEWTGSLTVSESEISTGKTFNIDELEKNEVI